MDKVTMAAERTIIFGPFRLEYEANTLWRGEQRVELRPRPLAVLCYLAERPGEVVSQRELLQRVWSGTSVTKAVLKVCVRTIREALGDDARVPRYIETVGRKGYRFIAPLILTQPVQRRASGVSCQHPVVSSQQSSRVSCLESRVQSPSIPTPYTLHPL